MALDAPKFRLPSLKALQSYEAAARHQSFARAAEELCVTAGAVAQQVKALEDWLGFTLFERQSHGLRLTEPAKDALPALIDAFDRMNAAVRQLRDSGPSNRLRIAALPCIAQLWLSPRLPRLRAAFPQMQISVTAMEGPPNFRREPYDLALFYLKDKARSLTAIPLAEETLFPICSPAIITGQEREAVMRRQPLLSDMAWDRDWTAWMAAAELDRRLYQEGASFSLYSLALQAVIDGGGFMIGRKTLVANALRRGDVIAPFDLQLANDEPLTLLMPTALTPDHRLNDLVAWLQASAGEEAA